MVAKFIYLWHCSDGISACASNDGKNVVKYEYKSVPDHIWDEAIVQMKAENYDQAKNLLAKYKSGQFDYANMGESHV